MHFQDGNHKNMNNKAAPELEDFQLLHRSHKNWSRDTLYMVVTKINPPQNTLPSYKEN
jgi:hypothetical protein